MKANLIFFDNYYESANGTLRCLIGFISILTLYSILHKIHKKLFILDYKIVISALLFASCLGVIKPQSSKGALVLGGLVGFVLFTIIGINTPVINTPGINTPSINTIYYILSGILIGLITNFIIWKIYWTTNMRIKGSNTLYICWHLFNLVLFIAALKYYNN